MGSEARGEHEAHVCVYIPEAIRSFAARLTYSMQDLFGIRNLEGASDSACSPIELEEGEGEVAHSQPQEFPYASNELQQSANDDGERSYLYMSSDEERKSDLSALIVTSDNERSLSSNNLSSSSSCVLSPHGFQIAEGSPRVASRLEFHKLSSSSPRITSRQGRQCAERPHSIVRQREGTAHGNRMGDGAQQIDRDCSAEEGCSDQHTSDLTAIKHSMQHSMEDISIDGKTPNSSQGMTLEQAVQVSGRSEHLSSVHAKHVYAHTNAHSTLTRLRCGRPPLDDMVELRTPST